MHLASFAQNQEDIMLWRALRDVEKGFYIDAGAADPSEYSVTRTFYDRQWRGINLEPNAIYFSALSEARPDDINLPIGAGREAGHLTFYDVDESGLSTFDAKIAAGHKANGCRVTEQVVEVLPLSEICRRYRPSGPIHFLKIDVEGSEADVLAGADFDAYRPWIVLVEATLPESQIESWESWEGLLTGRGYSFAWFDGLNRFYIADELRPGLEPHFRVQPNVFDGFETSGSLLARAEQAERSLRAAQAEAVRQAEVAAGAQQKAGRLNLELAAVRKQSAALSAQLKDAGVVLAATNDRLQDTLADLAAALSRADIAETQVRLMLESTSWRVSAPLRAIRRLQQRDAGSGAAPGTAADIPGSAKELARQLFHRSTRRLLTMPGGRQAVTAARSLAPEATEWLALRYRAYEHRAAHPAPLDHQPVPDDDPTEQAAAVAPAPIGEVLDLSEEEARLYRQMKTNDRATKMAVADA